MMNLQMAMPSHPVATPSMLSNPNASLTTDPMFEFVNLPDDDEMTTGGITPRQDLGHGNEASGSHQRASDSAERGSNTSPHSNRSRALSAGYSEEALSGYISREEGRCREHGIPWPDIEIPSKLTTHKLETQTLRFALGSPEAVASLKDMLSAQRNSPGQSFCSRPGMSITERVRLIQRMDHEMDLLRFLRRGHIHQLYLDCGGPDIADIGIFVRQENPMGVKRSPGNPRNASAAQLTDLMMRKLYPNLKEDTAEYKSERIKAAAWRQLGQRLDYIVQKFGYGVLGCLSSKGGNAMPNQGLTITDEM